jgi:hypothetical protein
MDIVVNFARIGVAAEGRLRSHNAVRPSGAEVVSRDRRALLRQSR